MGSLPAQEVGRLHSFYYQVKAKGRMNRLEWRCGNCEMVQSQYTTPQYIKSPTYPKKYEFVKGKEKMAAFRVCETCYDRLRFKKWK